MKWPWVSRLAYEAIRESNAVINNALSMERQVNAALLDRLLSLKMAGAVEVPKPIAADALVERIAAQHDKMRDLIHARAGSNYRMRNMMLSQLAVDRAEGKDPDAIRSAILNGVLSDGVPA